jgi:hypothetical protein
MALRATKGDENARDAERARKASERRTGKWIGVLRRLGYQVIPPAAHELSSCFRGSPLRCGGVLRLPGRGGRYQQRVPLRDSPSRGGR